MTIRIEIKQLESGLLELQIFAWEVPDNLFGMSFHLDIEGAGFSYKGHDPGNVFSGANPMVLVSEKDNESIVVGVSMRRNDQYTVEDGKLLSVYIKPLENGELSVDFSNKIVSVFDDGRMDIEGVSWNGINFMATGAENIEDTGDGEEGSEEVLDQKPEQDNEKILGSIKEAQTDVLWSNGEHDPIEGIYGVLGFSFLVLVFVFFVFLFVRRRRLKR